MNIKSLYLMGTCKTISTITATIKICLPASARYLLGMSQPTSLDAQTHSHKQKALYHCSHLKPKRLTAAQKRDITFQTANRVPNGDNRNHRVARRRRCVALSPNHAVLRCAECMIAGDQALPWSLERGVLPGFAPKPGPLDDGRAGQRVPSVGHAIQSASACPQRA